MNWDFFELHIAWSILKLRGLFSFFVALRLLRGGQFRKSGSGRLGNPYLHPAIGVHTPHTSSGMQYDKRWGEWGWRSVEYVEKQDSAKEILNFIHFNRIFKNSQIYHVYINGVVVNSVVGHD